jgi:hypothetical protein
MSPGVIAIVAFIGMVMIIGIPAGIVIRRVIRTERARSRKGWAAGTAGAVGTYDGGGGGCSGFIDCSGGIDSGGFGGGG